MAQWWTLLPINANYRRMWTPLLWRLPWGLRGHSPSKLEGIQLNLNTHKHFARKSKSRPYLYPLFSCDSLSKLYLFSLYLSQPFHFHIVVHSRTINKLPKGFSNLISWEICKDLNEQGQCCCSWSDFIQVRKANGTNVQVLRLCWDFLWNDQIHMNS